MAGTLLLVVGFTRDLRTSWLMVGIQNSQKTGRRDTPSICVESICREAARRRPLASKKDCEF
jgi:hypothetical protein